VVEEAAQTYSLRMPELAVYPQEIARLISLCKTHLSQLEKVLRR